MFLISLSNLILASADEILICFVLIEDFISSKLAGPATNTESGKTLIGDANP